MNLGNQNRKYSWRIRNLENPQTGTQFANSVLMYKILQTRLGTSSLGRPMLASHWPTLGNHLVLQARLMHDL